MITGDLDPPRSPHLSALCPHSLIDHERGSQAESLYEALPQSLPFDRSSDDLGLCVCVRPRPPLAPLRLSFDMAALPQGFPAGMFGMGGPGGAPAPLVKFKAGRCELEPLSGAQEGSFNVTPIKRKGEVQVVRNDEGMTQFLWKDRTTQQVDPACDHLVFPGDAKFEKISTGRDGDRVYSLQFTANASRRFFFWMQVPRFFENTWTSLALTRCPPRSFAG